jgi:hypothetical protein
MAVGRKKSVKKSDPSTVYELRATLLETDPPIWRRLQVPADVTLGDLNYILQATMGWTNSHLRPQAQQIHRALKSGAAAARSSPRRRASVTLASWCWASPPTVT